MPFYNVKSRKVIGKKAFTLIELLIVISIFALVSGSIAASYNNFQKNQNLKNEAASFKTDIRSLQNLALSGDKSTPNCAGASLDGSTILGTRLWGWYLKVDSSAGASYSINSDCDLYTSTGLSSCASSPCTNTDYGDCYLLHTWASPAMVVYECTYSYKTVSLPSSISITGTNAPHSVVYAMYQPASNSVVYYDSFVDTSGGCMTPTVPPPFSKNDSLSTDGRFLPVFTTPCGVTLNPTNLTTTVCNDPGTNYYDSAGNAILGLQIKLTDSANNDSSTNVYCVYILPSGEVNNAQTQST